MSRRPELVPVELTHDEANLLGWFRQMDVRRRGETLWMAVWYAEEFPMVKKPTAPSAPRGIRLAASFGKAVTA
jgi:hypothetical protein